MRNTTNTANIKLILHTRTELILTNTYSYNISRVFTEEENSKSSLCPGGEAVLNKTITTSSINTANT